METGIRHTHLLSVVLFLLIYLIKTFLLLTNKNEKLVKFTKTIKVPEMVISTLFLGTGIYLLTQIPEIKSLLIIKITVVLTAIPLAIIGFKKNNKALALLSLLLIIGAYGLAEMSKKQKTKAMENIPESSINGKELYTISCTPCHGEYGKLALMGATDLTQSTIDKTQSIQIIKDGKGAMTPFTGLLTVPQIDAVSEYIITLRK